MFSLFEGAVSIMVLVFFVSVPFIFLGTEIVKEIKKRKKMNEDYMKYNF